MNLGLHFNTQEVQVDSSLGQMHSCIPNYVCVTPGKGSVLFCSLSLASVSMPLLEVLKNISQTFRGEQGNSLIF